MSSLANSLSLIIRTRLALGAIMLVALGIRLWGLDQHNIWWDEGLSAWAAGLTIARILDWTAHDVHPPLHFLIQRAWWLVSGEGEWTMRFISALAGTAAVAAIYGLAGALGGRRAGLLAAVFLAVSGFAVTWSQELRMYVWASLWAPLVLYAALRVWRAHSSGAVSNAAPWWLLYIATASAGLWTLYLFVTVLLVANLAFLVFLLRATRPLALLARWTLAQLVVLGLFAPWLAYALPRMMSWSSSEPFSPAFFVRLYSTVLSTGIVENIEPWVLPTLLVLGVLIVSVGTIISGRRSPLATAGLVMLLLGVLLPGFMVYALTALPGRSFYIPRLAPRYFLPLACTFYTLLGWGVAELGRRARVAGVAAAGVVLAVALAGLLVLMPGRVATDQYVSLVDTLRAHEHPGDKVLLYPDQDWPLFAARYRGPWEKVPAGMDLTEENTPQLLAPLWESSESLWLVSTPKAQETDPRGLVRAWLEGRAGARADWDFGETRLSLYARTFQRAQALRDVGPGDTSGRSPVAAAEGTLTASRLPLRRYRIGDTLYAALEWQTPPSRLLSLGLREATELQEPVPAAPSVTQGPQRVVARLPLTPDLRPGTYHVVLRDQGREVASLGAVEFVSAQSGTTGVAEPQHRLDLRFGEHVHLLGYDLPDQVARPGDFVALALYWQTDGVLTDRYKVFTHLIGSVWNADQGNFLWGQQDNEPQADQLPTTRWTPGLVIVDRYRVKVDPKAPSGTYDVEIGMYGLMDGVRLKTSEGTDAVVLGQVQVK